MITLIAIALASAQASSPPAPDAQCPVDIQAMLALSIRAFDQDMNGGWRALARRPECRERAANLIRIFREDSERRIRTLYWHEGQLRAELGRIDQAVALMELARHAPIEHGQSQDDWNAYVDATIAFLRNDRQALLAARERLAAFPLPENYRYIDSLGVTRTGRPPGWPYNLDVVDALIRCFGRPYGEAYGSAECRHPGERGGG